jgi:hypothetical protein
MDKRKIYFEQVPLEAIKKIVEEEKVRVQQKDTNEPPPKIGKSKWQGGTL